MKNTLNTTPFSKEIVAASAIKMIGLLFEQHGEVPTSFTCMGEGGIGTLAPKIHADDDKDKFTENMRLACTAASAFSCVFFSEAWDLTISLEELLRLKAPPSQHPSRGEFVALHIESRGEKPSYFRFPITTDGNGKKTLGKPVQMPNDQFNGRFTNLLPARPTTEGERIIARCALERKGLFPFSNRANRFQNN